METKRLCSSASSRAKANGKTSAAMLISNKQSIYFQVLKRPAGAACDSEGSSERALIISESQPVYLPSAERLDCWWWFISLHHCRKLKANWSNPLTVRPIWQRSLFTGFKQLLDLFFLFILQIKLKVISCPSFLTAEGFYAVFPQVLGWFIAPNQSC